MQLPVRWLLADEVGLGKTIEAALIMNRLLHTQRIERCLVVVPEALTVQWLGELWRKYHHIFTLLDGARLADVERDFGPGFNPFDVHRRTVIALETLVDRPELTARAVSAGIDLLVVDEAQRLRRPPRHPGEPGYRAIAPIAALGRHVLLLSATPLEDDAHGFFRLLQLLRPDEFPEDTRCIRRAARVRGAAAPVYQFDATSRYRRLAAACAHACRSRSHGAVQRSRRELSDKDCRRARRPRVDPLARRRTLDRIRRSLASGAALKAVLGPTEVDLRQQADAVDAADPGCTGCCRRRSAGVGQTRRRSCSSRTGRPSRCCATRSAARRSSRAACSTKSSPRSGGTPRWRGSAPAMDPAFSYRPRRAARGETSSSATGWCSTTCRGGLPRSSSASDDSTGLDAESRSRSSTSVHRRGSARDVVHLFESLGLFREPMAGLEPQLAHLERALEDIALNAEASLTDPQLASLLAEAQAARTRIHDAAYRQLHRDPYRAELGPAILARVPADLEALIELVVVNAASRLGFRVERSGRAVPTRSSSAVRRSSTVCRASRRFRRSSEHSIVNTRLKTRPSTSSHRDTRSSKGCWRTLKTIPGVAWRAWSSGFPAKEGGGSRRSTRTDRSSP